MNVEVNKDGGGLRRIGGIRISSLWVVLVVLLCAELDQK